LSAPATAIVNNPARPLAWELQYIKHMTILSVVAAAVLLAQAQPSQPPDKTVKKDPNAPITMNGCVQRDYTDAKNANAYTFVDGTDGSRYRLSGKSVSKYSGMSVQVVGVLDTKKLKVTGGLWPSPNVAAQAGALDPAQAAVAALPGGPTTGVGNVDMPILNVTRLSLGDGECRK
jgi:hypothetical protein